LLRARVLLSLRARASAVTDAADRIRTVAARNVDATVTEGLTLAVGGGKAARAVGLHPRNYFNVTDDPRAVIESAVAGKHLPDQSVRLVFLGGAEVVRAIAPHRKRQVQRDYEQVKLAHGLAQIRSPEAMMLLGDLAVASKAKKAATALLRSRADYAREILGAAAEAGDAVAGKAVALLE
jgi:hypothetical protein